MRRLQWPHPLRQAEALNLDCAVPRSRQAVRALGAQWPRVSPLPHDAEEPTPSLVTDASQQQRCTCTLCIPLFPLPPSPRFPPQPDSHCPATLSLNTCLGLTFLDVSEQIVRGAWPQISERTGSARRNGPHRSRSG